MRLDWRWLGDGRMAIDVWLLSLFRIVQLGVSDGRHAPPVASHSSTTPQLPDNQIHSNRRPTVHSCIIAQYRTQSMPSLPFNGPSLQHSACPEITSHVQRQITISASPEGQHST